MCAQTCVALRYKTVGLCEAVPHANHPTVAVKNPAIHNQFAAVGIQLQITQRLAYSTRRYGDKQIISPLKQTARRPS